MKKIKTLIRKELMDILRDKKTLVMMVVVPVLLYPLIIIGMSLVMVNIMESQETEIHSVGYSAEYTAVADRLKELYKRKSEQETKAPASDSEKTAENILEFLPAQAGQEDEVRQITDAWLEFTADNDGVLHVEIQYASADQSSLYTRQAVEELLEDYREVLLVENLEKEGLEESFLYPVIYEAKDNSSVTESMGMDIGGSIGMMLIVTILLGAIYPAIDSTAGEKERGTLETLLTLPVTNFQMILSKYVSVALMASVTAVLSVLSLGGSVLLLMFGLSPEIAGEMQGFSVMEIVSAIPVLLVTLVMTALPATALLIRVLPGSAQNLEDTFLPMAKQPLWALLLVTAVMPGIGEEILFRGFLFGSIRKKLTAAVLISSFVFGLFHMSLIKLLPTALLGASFAWIVYKTGSIYVSMFFHFLNNTVSMLILKYPERAGELVPFLVKDILTGTETAVLLAVGTAMAALGLLWMRKTSANTHKV